MSEYKEEIKEKTDEIEEVKKDDKGQDEEKKPKEIHNNLEATEEEMENQKIDEDVVNINSLKEELQKKEEECADYYNRMLRLQADFTNYKRRTEKEKSDIYLYANEKFALDLLNIIDNLERALACQTEDKDNPLYTGIEMVLKQFVETMKKHGVEEIDALNKPFDANLHHAVMREEAEAQRDEVIEVLQKGYTIHGKVLRPAMVKVAQ